MPTRVHESKGVRNTPIEADDAISYIYPYFTLSGWKAVLFKSAVEMRAIVTVSRVGTILSLPLSPSLSPPELEINPTTK